MPCVCREGEEDLDDASTVCLLWWSKASAVHMSGLWDAHQVENDVSSAHEGCSFQGAISAQQHHVLKALALEKVPGHVVVPRDHPQGCALTPLGHAAAMQGRVRGRVQLASSALHGPDWLK